MGSDEAAQDPGKDQMLELIKTAQAAQKAQNAANDLKEKAKAVTNSKERERLLKEAYEKEVEASGHSKLVKRMQSGAWQGFGFGGGIGAATGMGLGTGLGMLLGGITAVPTTGLGMLIGAGVGAIHGPWIKLGGKEEKFEEADPERIVEELEAQKGVQQQVGSAGQDFGVGAASGSGSGSGSSNSEQKARRKPAKLEVRSKGKAEGGQQVSSGFDQVTTGVAEESKPKRKPKKLEIRSGKQQGS